MDAGQQIRKAVQAVSDGDIREAMVICSTGQRPSRGEAEVTLRICSHRIDGGSITCVRAYARLGSNIRVRYWEHIFM